MRKGETKPPKPFTEATLLAAMEHASRFVDDKDLKEVLDDDESHSGGIGTPATRAEVIEKLIQSEYVKLKGKQLRSILTGRNLIAVVSPELRNVEYTARMEQKLSQVERGERSTLEVMNLFRKEVAGIPRQVGEIVRLNGDAIRPRQQNPETESYGLWPKCGQPVIRKGKFWQCSTNKREKHPTAHGRQSAAAAGNSTKPSAAKTSPIRWCELCSKSTRSTSTVPPHKPVKSSPQA